MIPALNEVRGRIEAAPGLRGVVRASVFGSVARGGDARPTSDVDFLVAFEHGRTLLDLAGLRLDLAEVLNRYLRWDVRERYPEVPRHAIAGARDVLIHEYVRVDVAPVRVIRHLIRNPCSRACG